jgi:hypothetical protein
MDDPFRFFSQFFIFIVWWVWYESIFRFEIECKTNNLITRLSSQNEPHFLKPEFFCAFFTHVLLGWDDVLNLGEKLNWVKKKLTSSTPVTILNMTEFFERRLFWRNGMIMAKISTDRYQRTNNGWQLKNVTNFEKK